MEKVSDQAAMIFVRAHGSTRIGKSEPCHRRICQSVGNSSGAIGGPDLRSGARLGSDWQIRAMSPPDLSIRREQFGCYRRALIFVRAHGSDWQI
ncbi:hypothetical protein QUF80_08900 [Desulfococcaceae bacterium HSG8]|nr:hypothetical protein [Desulfococcaceae bacterium HSG8]